MRRDQSKEFGSIVRGYLVVYRVSADQSVLRVWWDALVDYDLAEIAQAFRAYARTHDKAPNPKAILELLRDPSRDWWSADIAWARIPKDEDGASYVNDEMLQAWSICNELWAEGDKLGARLAFSRQYDALVRDARTAGRTPQWFLTASAGNPSANDDAIENAVQWGILSQEAGHQQRSQMRLTQDHSGHTVESLIEAMPQQHQARLTVVRDDGELESRNERGRRHIAGLRRILAGSAA